MTESPETLGPRIREWRNAKRLSLREFAKLCDLTPGAISQIERGLVSPSLKTIRRISAALEVPVAWFFGEEEYGDPFKDVIVRKSERRLLKLGDYGVAKYLLTPFAPGQMETLLVTLEPHGTTGEEYYTHPGEEVGLVLKGRFQMEIEDEIMLLEEGDVYRFESTRPHRFSNPYAEPAEVIMTISPPFYCFQPASSSSRKRRNDPGKEDKKPDRGIPKVATGVTK